MDRSACVLASFNAVVAPLRRSDFFSAALKRNGTSGLTVWPGLVSQTRGELHSEPLHGRLASCYVDWGRCAAFGYCVGVKTGLKLANKEPSDIWHFSIFFTGFAGPESRVKNPPTTC